MLDNQTLDEYIKALSNDEKELLAELSLDNIDALIDMDHEVLVDIKNNSNPNLTDKQQTRRLEIINKIIELHTWAVVVKGSEQHSWVGKAYASNISDLSCKNKTHDRNIRQFLTYKFSQMGQSDLQEAIILDGSPKFIRYDTESEQFKSVDTIEQQKRVLAPPSYEEYPYTPYEFTDEELYYYIKRAKAENIESLYWKALSIVKQYNSQDEHKLILMAMNIVWSYFQDRFGNSLCRCGWRE